MSLDTEAQSLRATEGSVFEKVVAEILNALLRDDNICVVRARGSSLKEISISDVNLRSIMDFTRIPVKRMCDQMQLHDYPDLDLFALCRDYSRSGVSYRLLAIINCKVSFHARHTETAFWGLLTRLTSNIPFVVVTEDRDIYKPKSSELGASCESSTAARRILESFSDRVYLVNRYRSETDPKLLSDIALAKQHTSSYPVFDNPKAPNHTQYCRSVRPIDDLPTDLRRWRIDIVGGKGDV